MKKNEQKEKPFNITVGVLVYGTVTENIPEDMTIEQAIQWAKDNIDQIAIPDNLDGKIIEIDEDNCDFET